MPQQPAAPNFTLKQNIRSTKKKKQSRQDQESCIKHNQTVETEVILAQVIRRPSCLTLLFTTGVLLLSSMAAAQTSYHSIAGFVPYTKWECNDELSQNCINARANGTEPSKTTMCSNNLKAGLDFHWIVDKTTYFSTQWGLYCDKSELKLLIAEMFFMGSILGSLVSGMMYDSIGRRSCALIGIVMAIFYSFVSAYSPTPYHLLVFRIFQGFALFIYMPAAYIYMMEITPPRYRVALSTFFMIMWPMGTALQLLCFYIVGNWATLLSVTGVLLTLSTIPILFGPDSPRFTLVNLKREELARKGLELLFDMNGSKFCFDERKIGLTAHHGHRKNETVGIKLFKLYPNFTKQTIAQVSLWFIGSYLYYGFGYSFSELSDDIYLSFLYSILGEILANLMAAVLLTAIGRKWTISIFFITSGISFVVMLLPISSPEHLDIEVANIVALIGSMTASAAFASLYLFSFELAPTTHRGRVFSACQFSARMGSLMGIKTSVLFEKSRFITVLLFACLCVVGALVVTTLPETKSKPTPDLIAEVEKPFGNQVVENHAVSSL